MSSRLPVPPRPCSRSPADGRGLTNLRRPVIFCAMPKPNVREEILAAGLQTLHIKRFQCDLGAGHHGSGGRSQGLVLQSFREQGRSRRGGRGPIRPRGAAKRRAILSDDSLAAAGARLRRYFESSDRRYPRFPDVRAAACWGNSVRRALQPEPRSSAIASPPPRATGRWPSPAVIAEAQEGGRIGARLRSPPGRSPPSSSTPGKGSCFERKVEKKHRGPLEAFLRHGCSSKVLV